jgi:hypothetical protein
MLCVGSRYRVNVAGQAIIGRSECEKFEARMLALVKHVAKNTVSACRWDSVRAALALRSRQQGNMCRDGRLACHSDGARTWLLERSLTELTSSLRLKSSASSQSSI